MVLSETEWRQKELNKKIQKYKDGFYNDYYFEGENYLIVFVKHRRGNTARILWG